VRSPFRSVVALSLAATVALAGCGGSSGGPSVSSKMICASEAQTDLADLIGERPKTPPKPTWSNHVYSCRYVYGEGVMALSVRELPSIPATARYFASLAVKLGKTQDADLGQGGFSTKNGSVVVRKDNKVMLVDISDLPASFGSPPDPSSDIALNAAAAVLKCWNGD
jgi:hypothetical protein